MKAADNTHCHYYVSRLSGATETVIRPCIVKWEFPLVCGFC